MLNFFEMEMKFGPAGAYQCLAEIERAAQIASGLVADLDPETRLSNAMRAQDELNSFASPIAA